MHHLQSNGQVEGEEGSDEQKTGAEMALLDDQNNKKREEMWIHSGKLVLIL